MELSFEMISQNFLDNLVNNIAQTNKTELVHRREPNCLGIRAIKV